MSLRSFLYREARWIRHHAPLLVLVLIVLPGLFAGATLAFQQVIPRDMPIAVAPANDAVDDDSLTAVKGVSAVFSRPRIYEDRAAAVQALHREEVYAVFVVPPDLFESGESVTIEMVVEREMVPIDQPSIAIRNLLDAELDGLFPADVDVERTPIGDSRTLTEFLLSAGAMVLAMIYAFVLLPHVVASERGVYRRVRVTDSLGTLLAAKLLTFTGLLVVPLVAFQLLANHLGLRVDLLSPGAVGVTLLTFLTLGAVAVAVMFVVGFDATGRLLNAAILLATLVFGSLVYPPGFFSPLRREIARLLPVHHAMIVQRGVSLKDQPIGLYSDTLIALVGVAIVAVLLLVASVRYYEWRA